MSLFGSLDEAERVVAGVIADVEMTVGRATAEIDLLDRNGAQRRRRQRAVQQRARETGREHERQANRAFNPETPSPQRIAALDGRSWPVSLLDMADSLDRRSAMLAATEIAVAEQTTPTRRRTPRQTTPVALDDSAMQVDDFRDFEVLVPGDAQQRSLAALARAALPAAAAAGGRRHGTEMELETELDLHDLVETLPERPTDQSPSTRTSGVEVDTDTRAGRNNRRPSADAATQTDDEVHHHARPCMLADFITAADVARGADPQGVRWKTSPTDAREEFRNYRLATYENYYNCYGPYCGDHTEATPCGTFTSSGLANADDGPIVEFCQSQTREKCGLVHFQLRNLLAAPSRDAVHFAADDAVRVYDPLSRTFDDALRLDEIRAPRPPFKIASLAITQEYICVGGFRGEYAFKRRPRGPIRHTNDGVLCDDEDDAVHAGIVTEDLMAITNHIDARETRSGRRVCTISSNDSCLRELDIDRLSLTRERYFAHALNCSATSTDRRLNLVVGDHCDTLLVDADSGDVVRRIDGHWDYSFACAWSGDGHTFATGSQDRTARIYDARSPARPLCIYKTLMGAVRSLKFSPDGRCLAVAEPADFVHLYDMNRPGKRQTIDMFGEIAGVDWAADQLFIGNADRAVGGVFEYTRARPRCGLEDVLL